MRYVKSMDIWALKESQIRALPIGQWVYAGTPDAKGKYLGTKPSGTVVVAWLGNVREHKGTGTRYMQTLRHYALGQ